MHAYTHSLQNLIEELTVSDALGHAGRPDEILAWSGNVPVTRHKIRCLRPAVPTAFGLAIVVSSVPCECGFSTMAIIKTKLRNRLSVLHLEDLMQVALNSPKMNSAEYEAFIEEVYSHWFAAVKRNVNKSHPGIQFLLSFSCACFNCIATLQHACARCISVTQTKETTHTRLV